MQSGSKGPSLPPGLLPPGLTMSTTLERDVQNPQVVEEARARALALSARAAASLPKPTTLLPFLSTSPRYSGRLQLAGYGGDRAPQPPGRMVSTVDLAASQNRIDTEGVIHPTSIPPAGSPRRRRWNTPRHPGAAAVPRWRGGMLVPERPPRFSYRRTTGLQSVPRVLPTVDDVAQFLATIGLGRHAPAFVRNRIDGRLLLKLSDDFLKRLGVKALCVTAHCLVAYARAG
jgi:hypothetical protein